MDKEIFKIKCAPKRGQTRRLKKMNKKLLGVLFISIIVMSIGIVMAKSINTQAKTTIQKIEFNLNGHCYNPLLLFLQVNFNGNLKENKDGEYYLSPQKGAIIAGGKETKILIKSSNKIIDYSEDIIGTPDSSYYYKYQSWFVPLEINIKSIKYTGLLKFYKYHERYSGGATFGHQIAYLSFDTSERESSIINNCFFCGFW